jgi:hypothetical protein
MFRFRNIILENFPFLEDDFDAVDDYHLFSKMVGYMRKAIEQLTTYDSKFIDFNNRLTNIENYLATLDLQDEVNNKLDEMYENGQLQSLIEDFIDLQVISYQYIKLVNGWYVLLVYCLEDIIIFAIFLSSENSFILSV